MKTNGNIAENFIALYRELVASLPHLAVHNFRCENSDYSDQLIDSRNAYLCFNGDRVEDCFYTYDSRWNKNCADLTYSNKCELCYSCIDSEKCYNSSFLQDCESCVDCTYGYDCFSCHDCFGCVGLRRAEFCIFNKPYEKSEYFRKLAEVKVMSEDAIFDEMEKLKLAHPRVAMHSRNCENVFGDYVFDSKNCHFIFKGHELETSAYVSNSRKLKDCVDCDMTHRSELTYEAIEDNQNYNSNFLYWCADLRDSEYMMYSFNCENCFGCFNLKRKKFHILNQPYPEAEYFELVSRVRAELRRKNQYQNFLPDIVRI